MRNLYSKSTGGFYSLDVHLPSQIPIDAVPVSDYDYAQIFLAQESGAEIKAGANGSPVAVIDLDAITASKKQLTILSIKEKRKQVENGGVLVAGDWYSTSVESESDMNSIFNANGSRDPGTIVETLNGQEVLVGKALAKDILNALLNLKDACRLTSKAHITAVQVSANPEAYDYSTGWPAVYGG